MSKTPSVENATDWLVVGAGVGGLAAALCGALHGMDVMLCEKSSQVGGTAATSAGTLWIPGNRQNPRAGFDADSVDAARHYLDGLIEDPKSGQATREAFLMNGADAIDWYETKAGLRFIPCGVYPDYLDAPGAAAVGRALIPAPFDGRKLGKHFERIRPPIAEFMIFGGMMVGKADIAPLVGRFNSWANLRYTTLLFARYLVDRLRYSRGTRLMLGNALIAQLYSRLLAAGVPARFNIELRSLLTDGPRVVGAVLAGPGGPYTVRARRGVVLATGGLGHHSGLRQRFMGADWPDSMAVPENTGQGIEAGLSIGALSLPERHGTGAFWTPVSRTGSGQWAGRYPHLAMDRAKPGLIAVNRQGRRFVNEAASYHHFALAMLEQGDQSATDPAWLICNHAFIRRYGLGAIHPGTTHLQPYVERGWIHCAGSLRELAGQLEIDAAGLSDTATRLAAFAANGIDEDFGKGSTRLNRYNGDPTHQPNPCLGPLGDGPYCAMPVWPAELGTSTGLETDPAARVLNTDGQVISGLYACGNDQGSIMRGTYPGPGTTLGPALVFAWLAARDAAGWSPGE